MGAVGVRSADALRRCALSPETGCRSTDERAPDPVGGSVQRGTPLGTPGRVGRPARSGPESAPVTGENGASFPGTACRWPASGLAQARCRGAAISHRLAKTQRVFSVGTGFEPVRVRSPDQPSGLHRPIVHPPMIKPQSRPVRLATFVPRTAAPVLPDADCPCFDAGAGGDTTIAIAVRRPASKPSRSGFRDAH